MDDQDSRREHCFLSYLQATEEVLLQVLDMPVEKGEVVVVESPSEILEVAVLIGLTGDLEGRVMFEFQTRTALKIVSVMNFGEPFDSLDQMARATLQELGNLIAGRAVTLCNDEGSALGISPPMLVCGIGVRTTDQAPVKKISVKTPCGEVLVNLSLRARRRGPAPTFSHNRLTTRN